jgi:hypothetical protein
MVRSVAVWCILRQPVARHFVSNQAAGSRIILSMAPQPHTGGPRGVDSRHLGQRAWVDAWCCPGSPVEEVSLRAGPKHAERWIPVDDPGEFRRSRGPAPRYPRSALFPGPHERLHASEVLFLRCGAKCPSTGRLAARLDAWEPSRHTYVSASKGSGQCLIRCQIRGFEGSGGDKNFKNVSNLLIPIIPPAFESLPFHQ